MTKPEHKNKDHPYDNYYITSIENLYWKDQDGNIKTIIDLNPIDLKNGRTDSER